jgi:small-conductance mechanosensitive channel
VWDWDAHLFLAEGLVPVGMADFKEILQYHLFTIAGTTINVSTLLGALVIVTISVVMARLTENGAVRFLGRGVQDEGSARATGRLAHYVVLAIGFSLAIQSLGIDLTALFAAGAFLAIAFGFAMQNITQNFVSGLILLVERTIKPGDIIEVEGRLVKVTELGMRATVVRTWDAEDFIIPNSVLVSTTVKNLTLKDRLYRIRSLVGVTYDSDMAQVRKVLEETARVVPWRDQGTDPVILMKQFGSSSVDFDVSVWVNDPFARALSQSDLNEAIWRALKEAEIVIAFPQLNVHFDK